MKVEFDMLMMYTITYATITIKQQKITWNQSERSKKKGVKIKQTTYRMIDLSPTISIITLSVNGLKIPIRGKGKKRPNYILPTKKCTLDMKHK